MKQIRLDKFLTDSGIGTRSEVKNLIKKGQIAVNGSIVKKSDIKIDATSDKVSYQGKELRYSEFHYYMLYKPAGVLSATEDKNQETVLDLLKGVSHKNLFPVGRLDKDTEGLLLITDDGALAHSLLSPKKHVDKTYYLIADGKVEAEDLTTLSEGVDIGEEKKTLPAKAKLISYDKAADRTELLLTIHEGKFHQVKRMMEAVGKPALYLKRLSMGSLVLDEKLEKGCFRELTDEEISCLRQYKIQK
jgi:16S rRNA pseudouridine516 synthase